MKKTERFNLLDIYEISVVDDKIYWVEAVEWQDEFGEVENAEPGQVFTDYLHGECEIVDLGTLVLNPPKEINNDEGDAYRFYEELKSLPKWGKTECCVMHLGSAIPDIRYCRNGNHIPLDYALYVMKKLGYTWNPDSDRFEKVEPEEKPAA